MGEVAPGRDGKKLPAYAQRVRSCVVIPAPRLRLLMEGKGVNHDLALQDSGISLQGRSWRWTQNIESRFPGLELSYLSHSLALFSHCQQPSNPPELLHHCRVRLN